MSNKLIILAGPTASGKTALALQLAEIYPFEIISVDSALIYRDMNIGSAKPNTTELSAVPHHLIDIRHPLENYSVAEFLADCKNAIETIYKRGKLPLLVGGTMMYYNALLNGVSNLPEANQQLRTQLGRIYQEKGAKYMHQWLSVLDSLSAVRIEVNDRQRVERALEVCLLTKQPLSLLQRQNKAAGLINDYQVLPMALMPQNRQLLHERINQRFLDMLDNGFVDEVVNLKQQYPKLTNNHNSMRAVGYRQVWQYLAGEFSLNELAARGAAATRQLAKRQLTWLKNMSLQRIDHEQLDLACLKIQLATKIELFLSQ